MTFPAAPPPPPPPAPAPMAGRRPRLWPPIVMLVAGVAIGIAGVVVFFAVGLEGILGATAHQAPTTVAIRCQVGDYYVYQQVGTGRSGPGITTSSPDPLTLTTAQVAVTGPSGGRVETWRGTGAETIALGSISYGNAVGFHAAVPGRYLVRIAEVHPSSIVVAPSLGDAVLRAAPWLGLAGAGGLLAVAGTAWLIVALVRRRRVGRIDPWGGPPPPLAPGAVPPGPWLPRNYDPFPAPAPPRPAPPSPPAPPPPPSSSPPTTESPPTAPS